MPYIKQKDREQLDPLLAPIIRTLAEMEGTGGIAYCITRLIDEFYGRYNFGVFCIGLGLLEAVKQEFYRRRLAPYEDMKCQGNGEVYK
jgi:hypothetical protein